MKKVLFIFIPLILAVTVFLCACGNNNGDTSDHTDTYGVSETDTGAEGMSLYENEGEDTAGFDSLFG